MLPTIILLRFNVMLFDITFSSSSFFLGRLVLNLRYYVLCYTTVSTALLSFWGAVIRWFIDIRWIEPYITGRRATYLFRELWDAVSRYALLARRTRISTAVTWRDAFRYGRLFGMAYSCDETQFSSPISDRCEDIVISPPARKVMSPLGRPYSKPFWYSRHIIL